MNERFWELVEQADEQGGDDPDIRDQVFAELIVRECIELNKQELAFNAFERMLNRYREHFGVEE